MAIKAIKCQLKLVWQGLGWLNQLFLKHFQVAVLRQEKLKLCLSVTRPQLSACQTLCTVNSTVLGTPRPRAGVNLPVQPKEQRVEHKGPTETCQHANHLKYPRPVWPLL